MKKIFALSAASILTAAPAVAGPYVNVESNSGWANGDYSSTLLEAHVGYAGVLNEEATWYVQAGPAFGFVPDEDNVSAASGKVGVTVDVTERLEAYGEVSAITADDWDFEELGVGVKAGLTFNF